MPGPPDPRAAYDARRTARVAERDRLERNDRRLADARLVAFGLLALVAVAAPTTELVTIGWTLPPLLLFFVLVVWHARIIETKERAVAAVAFYDAGLARIDDRWQGTGLSRDDYADELHPYAPDLDLFGRGSLFELLCTARTGAGETTLARWLLHPAPHAELRQRHAAIDELRGRLDLREELGLLAGGVRSEVHPDLLIGWGKRQPVFAGGQRAGLRVVAWALTLMALGSIALAVFTPIGPWAFVAVAVIEWAVSRWLRDRLRSVMGGIEEPERELSILAAVLARVESEPFDSAHLTALQKALTVDGVPASNGISALCRRVGWHDWMRNQLFAPIGFVLMWHLHLALSIDGWRERWGPAIAEWLTALGELEALLALSGYAYEHPADPFPDLVDDGPRFDGEALGHPLLAESACVRNSVRIGAEPQVWVVSGSNMSGKSTLLRTVGINAVLALCGAPVRAARLAISPVVLGATIRVIDSLQGGSSRFYAEIQRLKQLMDLTGGQRPLLFLLDEILHGTNSHDRQIGAEALVRSFIDAGAIGLVTTHDLALTRAAEALGEATRNVHFVDHLEDGKLVFDYTVRPGVVQKSNAIELMRSVGLQV